jgi:mono/diheme cytochrome c family protein
VTSRAPAVAFVLALAACSKGDEAPAPPSTSVHTLRLPAEAVATPEAPGRGQFLSGCSTCHSPRYVLDQPPLTRKTWQAEVDKMRTTYGAPIAPADAPAIVDYVVAVRGNGS